MNTPSILNDIEMESSKEHFDRSKELIYKCKVCTAPATYSYFGVICCSPCKMFFKRNAELDRKHIQCNFGNQCEINLQTRQICSACRLTKCFTIGMKVELLRGSRSRKNRKRKTGIIQEQLEQSSTINLLKTDQTILTIEQWNMLSHVCDLFNEKEQLFLVNEYLSKQNNLPLKLRFKYGSIQELVLLLMTRSQTFFEKNSNFLSLCTHDRTILLHRLTKYIAFITFSFIEQITHLIDDPSLYKLLQTLFGSCAISMNKKLFTRLDHFDVLFLKLSLLIICFSTFDHVIYEKQSADNLTNIKQIMKNQDIYIDLAWRYLVHEYNEQQATKYFSNLIQYLFVVHQTVISIYDGKYFRDIIHSVIEQTEKTFAP
ncbi:hypothetical protein I4U23_012060 [Adineta vaga]|nr:hypothetical protein I4U23_012060 [Adineta vaga]